MDAGFYFGYFFLLAYMGYFLLKKPPHFKSDSILLIHSMLSLKYEHWKAV